MKPFHLKERWGPMHKGLKTVQFLSCVHDQIHSRDAWCWLLSKIWSQIFGNVGPCYVKPKSYGLCSDPIWHGGKKAVLFCSALLAVTITTDLSAWIRPNLFGCQLHVWYPHTTPRHTSTYIYHCTASAALVPDLVWMQPSVQFICLHLLCLSWLLNPDNN